MEEQTEYFMSTNKFVIIGGWRTSQENDAGLPGSILIFTEWLIISTKQK